MKTKIENLEDIQRQKLVLKAQLAASHQEIKMHVQGIKEDLNPLRSVVSFAKNRLFTPQGGLLVTVAGLVSSRLLKNTPLGRFSLLTNAIVPLIVAGSQQKIREQSNKWLVKGLKWLERKTSRLPEKYS